MHRVAIFDFSILHAQRCTERNGTTTWTMHCQSASCVLELWVGYSSSLHGRGQALSARTGVLRVQPLTGRNITI
jgi:type VI protein secretion system component VasF